ncbi:hypothetical protein ND861_18870 [Leptospira sp. 2 VSF19]|uniref:Site-specific DNA-methyltransferase (adenine-specific) n=1 Tax=Leptospira soteropolitanensis TaxID=2950025 RepID=A0AAW5VRQ7_9LEPT|nr:hypothetical protein [Leptospira soteropolitanensis]MCW7494729.1 hypothetical protein [Leptospira soteropolitanensis]MCW7502279.1 hypothetical protein [Leptospira soteropolitanensis]MCW7524555.1 hypothetical protein [Leptospira soteropolitanensis]MCW7528428.1 hypothetical protein [Leptospira soteropolitanensis]MCW7532283.1 hypothetical protein [Leptospira soteropolitanensis]
MNKDLKNLREYVESESTERSKDHLIFPLFKNLFSSNKFKKEADANGADIYIEGRLLVELKTHEKDWLSAYYQSMHYKRRGLTYSTICIISHNFIGLWKLNQVPKGALELINNSDSTVAPSEIGKRNAKKTTKGLAKEILDSSYFLFDSKNSLYIDSQYLEFLDYLKNIDSERIQINPQNFLRTIGELKPFFRNSIDAIHCFYTMLPYWDTTSQVPFSRDSSPSIIWINGKNGTKASEEFTINPQHHQNFRKYVESRYVFTNDQIGINIDYYFSRFDEALAAHDSEYVKQHGIFFTDINLSKFALWFIREKFGEKKLSDKYIVFDPAGGSGNLISSWRRNHLKFKVVSELNPDLLKTIELRLKNDPIQIKQGYTVIPKTTENKGLNFLDKSAAEYYNIIKNYLSMDGKTIDKPFAFLLNPPYKNTREEEKFREKTSSNYLVNQQIIDLVKSDASKERFVHFLAQILEIAKIQKNEGIVDNPIIFIFSPTSWLIPRVGFKYFREVFDEYFKFEGGFFVTSSEFFEVDGKWPVSFTIWKYNYKKNNTNQVILSDYSDLKKTDLNINWDQDLKDLNKLISKIIRNKKKIDFGKNRHEIRDELPPILLSNGKSESYKMLNLYRSKTKDEENIPIISGWPLKDDRHSRIKAPHGYTDGDYIGFMDDLTPVRLRRSLDERFSNPQIQTVWFRLDTAVKDGNKCKIFSGPTDNRSYCAYNLPTAKILFLWYALGKITLNNSPLWANQMEIWFPNRQNSKLGSLIDLSFSYGLSENRCIVTKFEANNPAQNSPEIFIENPMCPINPDSFWSLNISDNIKDNTSLKLISSINELYEYWNSKYCKGQFIFNCGLKDEPYFSFFEYQDFVSPHSGLIQIRKFAELSNKKDLLDQFDIIKENTKNVREKFLTLLKEDFKYYD